ncbi:sulfotransferase family protein [Thalassobellus suaedae]|uniref:Sulfotransferase n=1 Tax=Thalassobellus suaedae TaxID=3074124 RepID=A0ABY9XUL0_9FLAO|nr:sulfotransferase [Flavobacteriaceae bacterium HL-DH14]
MIKKFFKKLNKVFVHFNIHKKIPRILLVTGTGRSGTTMLRKSLGQHNQIYYRGNENNIFLDIVSTFHKNCTMKSRKVAMELSQVQYDVEVKKIIFSILFPALDKNRKYKYFLIASALDSKILEYIKVLFPNIKILQIIRNGIEVVSSRMNYEGFKYDGFENHIEVWNKDIEIGKHCKEIFGDNYKIVKQECFLDSWALKKNLEEIFDWLEVKYDDNVYNSISQTKFHPTVIKIEDAVNLKNRVDRWGMWSEEQKALFKDKALTNMKALGYKIPDY